MRALIIAGGAPLTKGAKRRIIPAIPKEDRMAQPIEVTDDTFEDEVLQSSDPTLVDFWSARCRPCLMIAPVLEEVAEEYDGKLRVAKVDVDRNQGTLGKLGIFSIPTMILFKDGKELERVVGYQPKEALMETILPHLA
jgi:thioredoxin 1